MGRTLRIVLPCALGLLAAFLVSCGSSSSDKKLIPGNDAAAINQNVDAASSASGDGRCGRADAAVTRAETHVQQLPSSVDSRLKANLQQGLERLRAAAATECAQNQQQDTTTTESTPSTETTDTTPTETQTTETQNTETQNTETQNTETQNTDTSGGGNGNGSGNGNGTGNGNGNGNGNSGGSGSSGNGGNSSGGTQAP